ncbi:hypothetical protein J4G07_08165 [Candidatus Poribacteria bacterium]|nr:hypothetical protein [Candidatus Poribacteria bacterium]
MNLYEVLEEVRQWVGDRKATSPYTKEGCRVSMADLQSKPVNRVVLDVDRAFPTDRAKTNQCDLILFHINDAQNDLVVVPMELKGDPDASKIIRQLQEGARIVDNCTPDHITINLVPVLVHGPGMHKYQRNRLRTARIRFRGEKFPINTTTCSHQGNLAQALKKSTKR